MRWEVSTLPAATAAGGRAATIEPSRSRTSMRSMSPPPAGSATPSSLSVTHRNA